MTEYLTLVRHGQTYPNQEAAEGTYRIQPPDSRPTVEGELQTMWTGWRLRQLVEQGYVPPVEAIDTSEDWRARVAAYFIGSVLGGDIPRIVHETLHERRDPKRLEGSIWDSDDPEEVEIRDLIRDKEYTDYRYPDGYHENWEAVRRRVVEYYEELKQRPERHIVAVSHGGATRVMRAVQELGPGFDISRLRDYDAQLANGSFLVTKNEKGAWKTVTSPEFAAN